LLVEVLFYLVFVFLQRKNFSSRSPKTADDE